MATACAALTLAEAAAAPQMPNPENEDAMERSQRATRVAEKAYAAAMAAQKVVSEWALLARGAAHSGVYLVGIRGRIAVSAKAEHAPAPCLPRPIRIISPRPSDKPMQSRTVMDSVWRADASDINQFDPAARLPNSSA